MSGDQVRLLDEGGSVVRLVTALDDVVAGASGHAALIGGMAVLARAAGAYRVTDDIDAVAEPDTLRFLLAERGRRVGASWTVDGVKIDLVEVGTTPAEQLVPADLPDDEADRMFVLAHQWALDTATQMEIMACDERVRPLATASCRVATPSALVAMKVQSAPRALSSWSPQDGQRLADVHRLLTAPGSLRQRLRPWRALRMGWAPGWQPSWNVDSSETRSESPVSSD